jgi:hypothetical protein
MNSTRKKRNYSKATNHVILQEGNERQLQDWDDCTDDKDENFAKTFGEVILDAKISEADKDFTPDTFNDAYWNKKIAVARGANEVQLRKVTKRLRDADGRPIGTTNDNPLLDTRKYAVEFRDGRVESVSANLIAQNLYSQLDDKGKRHILLTGIVDHRRDERAIDKRDAVVIMKKRDDVKRHRGGNYLR